MKPISPDSEDYCLINWLHFHEFFLEKGLVMKCFGMTDFGLLFIAAFGVYIQRSFLKLAERNRADNVFDEQYKIFQDFLEIKERIIAEGETTNSLQKELYDLACKAEFFFPDNVVRHIYHFQYEVRKSGNWFIITGPMYAILVRPFLDCMRFTPLKKRGWFGNSRKQDSFEMGSPEQIKESFLCQEKFKKQQAEDKAVDERGEKTGK